MMRVLVCHVHYAQPGGEDIVFRNEVDMLRDAGLDIRTLEPHSGDINDLPLSTRADIALRYSDHAHGRRLVRTAVEAHRPDIVHFHNIYPHIGPGGIAEADRLGCATLQTLHNHRVSCLTGRNERLGGHCDECRPTHFAAGVLHGCYRGSRAQSLMVGRATTRQWRDFVHRRTPLYWLVLTTFMKQFYVDLGAPSERIIVKANSVRGGSPLEKARRDGVVCAGRLSPEKGIVALMRAWPDDGPTLTVAGRGPMEREARAATRHNVRFVGQLDADEMRGTLRRALVVATPSVAPEALPLVVLEALAEGTPVVTFDRWSIAAVMRDVSDRCLVPYPQFPALARRAVDLAGSAEWQTLSDRCVSAWRRSYDPSTDQSSLLAIYERVLASKRARSTD